MIQAWALSVELFFYLCAPLILYGLQAASSRMLILMAVSCAAVMVALWVPAMSPQPDLFVGLIAWYLPVPLMRTTEFLYGALLCKLFLRHADTCGRLGAGLFIWTNLVAIVALLSTSNSGWIVSAAMALTGLLILQIAAAESLLSRFLSAQPLLLLGASSYALYLIQTPIRKYLELVSVIGLGAMLNPLVTVGASVLIFLLWEEPARHWLRNRLSARPHPEAPLVSKAKA